MKSRKVLSQNLILRILLVPENLARTKHGELSSFCPPDWSNAGFKSEHLPFSDPLLSNRKADS